MGIESSPQDQSHGLGVWHPAMRPDSHQSVDLMIEKEAQDGTAPRLRSSFPPEASVPSAESYPSEFPQELLPLNGDSPKTSNADVLPSDSVNHQNNILPSSNKLHEEDIRDRATSRSLNQSDGRSRNLTVKSVFGLTQQDDTEFMDDIKFPEYSSFQNDDARGFAGVTSDKSGSDNSAWKSAERVDKAWNLGKSSQGFGEDSSFDRTNSFPEVPPLHKSKPSVPQTLPLSQAMHIMGEGNETEELGKSHLENKTSYLGESQDDFDFSTERGFFANAGESRELAPHSPADDEARFEEGLPLMPPKSQDEDLGDSIAQDRDLPGSSNKKLGMDEDFFGEEYTASPDDPAFFRPQSLDRKTTVQVLGSLKFSPDGATHGDPDDGEVRPSEVDLNSGEIAVSPGTIKPEASPEKQLKEAATKLEPPTIVGEPMEEDLAAIWRAALDDDELLEEESSLDPSSFFKDDGEGFLEEIRDQAENDGSLPQPLSPVLQQVSVPRAKHMPASSQTQTNPPAGTFSHQDTTKAFHPVPQTSSGAFSSFSTPDFTGPSVQQQHSFNAPPTSRPPMPRTTQSFSDKSKGGYTSPYDLPMDVIRPKKRTHLQQMQTASDVRASSHAPPPPRSSSMFSGGISPTVESTPPVSNLPSGNMSPPVTNSRTPSANISNAVPNSKSNATSFFEELPSSKPRPSNSRGKPATFSVPSAQPTVPFHGEPPRQNSYLRQPISSSSGNSQGYQLLPPERMGLFTHTPQTESTGQAPVVNSRYSPAPASQPNVPPNRNRYASSPSSGSRPPPSQSLPFQPRTSSPLAQHHTPTQHISRSPENDALHDSNYQKVRSQPLSSHNLPTESRSRQPDQFSNYQNQNSQAETDTKISSDLVRSSELSPSISHAYVPTTNSSSKPPQTPQTTSNYILPGRGEPVNDAFAPPNTQQGPIETSENSNFAPPRRSQTQSPSAMRSSKILPIHFQEPYQRPASTNYQASLPYLQSSVQRQDGIPEFPQDLAARNDHIASKLIPPASENGSQKRALVNNFGAAGGDSAILLDHAPSRHTPGKSLSQRFDYIKPVDGRENDPLERWKGCPIFSFGFGGTIVSSFPKQIPRYSAGQTLPMIKCSPGEVKLHASKIVPLDENISSFPGPLKSKSKKKEVLDWLQMRILRLKSTQVPVAINDTFFNPENSFEEKILLWKVLQILVEYDGVIDGNPAALRAVRNILSPELTPEKNDSALSYYSSQGLIGISRNDGSLEASDVGEIAGIEALRKILLHGERERAVWHAVDQRLWPHAMLLASTLDPKVWKQVLQEFIRQEVRTCGKNTESLASLYQIFAGNWEESMDEIVSPSARAGLQMVSKVAGAGPAKNAFDGLNRWRETLTLILSNRSKDDWNALVALGRLLSSYGRTEAAHICFIFAKSAGVFGGADDPQVSVALLGADHIRRPQDYNRDFDSILLTEIYDFACTVLAPSTVATFSSHIQSYKLYHAMILAEYGYRSEAQQYCDSIAGVLKSTTKLSPYFHGRLFGALEDLTERLRQAPADDSASWRPSIDKVSGSVWARLGTFIVGDENDSGSAASGKGLEQDLSGPFARVVGDSPVISRPASSSDLYSGYPVGNVAPAPGTGTNLPNSRYAPVGQYTPRSSLEQTRNWSSQETRQESQGDNLRPMMPHQQYQSRNNSFTAASQEPPPNSYKPSAEQIAYPSQSQSYLPTPPARPEYIPNGPPENISPSPLDYEYRPTPPPKDSQRQENHNTSESRSNNTYEPPSPNYNITSPYESPATSSYEPPATDSYEPPSYNPDSNEESPVEAKSKKKSFMDDDDDDDDEEFDSRAAAALKAEKAKGDREADEAFRKAAEADGIYPPNHSPLNF